MLESCRRVEREKGRVVAFVRQDVDPMRLVGEARFLKHSMMPTFTPLGVGAEKSCSRSGRCAGQRAKIG